MIVFRFNGKEHEVEDGQVTGHFAQTLTRLFEAAPVFSAAVEPDRDLAALQWIGFYIPVEIASNDFDPEKVESEHVGSMSEWLKREIEKAKGGQI